MLNRRDTAEPPIPAFVMVRKPPVIVQAEPPEPKILRIDQLYANVPSRALRDERIKDGHLRLLAACGVHAKSSGTHYPRIERLAVVAGTSGLKQ